MDKHFRICFTSDTHGYLFPTDYLDNDPKAMGVLSLGAAFSADENTLILDGGDTLQGSPLTNYYHRLSRQEQVDLLQNTSLGADPFAAAMNACGYQYVCLGNHDFNMGLDALGRYLHELKAQCLCCNIRDKAHRLPVKPWAIHTFGNGLRVGIVGACTDFVRLW